MGRDFTELKEQKKSVSPARGAIAVDRWGEWTLNNSAAELHVEETLP